MIVFKMEDILKDDQYKKEKYKNLSSRQYRCEIIKMKRRMRQIKRNESLVGCQ